MSIPKSFISLYLKSLNIEVVPEYKFLPDRKFRADWYIPSLSLLIEYEGIMSAKSRHTSVTGYSKDSEKYNLATLAGYRILRYTTMNYKDLPKHLDYLLASPLQGVVDTKSKAD